SGVEIDHQVGALIDRGPAVLASGHAYLAEILQRAYAFYGLVQDDPQPGLVAPLAAGRCADRGGASNESASLVDDRQPITHLYEAPQRFNHALVAALRSIEEQAGAPKVDGVIGHRGEAAALDARA